MSGEFYAILGIYFALAINCVALVKLWVEVKAMQKSTHTVQYVDPLSKAEPQVITEELKKAMSQTDLENIV